MFFKKFSLPLIASFNLLLFGGFMTYVTVSSHQAGSGKNRVATTELKKHLSKKPDPKNKL